MIRAAYIRNAGALLIVVLSVPFLVGAQPATDITQTPEFASVPYQFKNEGIFGCSQTAGAAMSVGTLSAIGGVYVPVNDAAVTLNTGVLVYKECILRPLIDRLREAATAGLVKKAVTGTETGREGNKRYVVDRTAERLENMDKEVLTFFTDSSLDTVNPAFRQAISTALARNYRAETRGAKNVDGSMRSDCDYGGDINADITDPTQRRFSLANFEKLANTGCNPFLEYLNKKDERDARIALADYNLTKQWEEGRGFYAVTNNARDPLAEKILTPASVVQESFQEILGSPLRQLESANDIGQMIGALFSGITTQITTDNKGLAGLTQSVGGQPSYLDQVAKESSQNIVGAAVNAALTILNAARQNEASYLASMNAIASSLTQAIARLRGAENQCWALIISNPSGPHVCATPLTANKTCTAVVKCTENADGTKECPTAPTLQVATSTAFSQGVIDSQIGALANVSITNVQASEKALRLIDQLIQGVTNTSSLNAQRISLQQLDSLVAQKALHSQYDAQRAAEQLKDVQAAMANLITDTVTAWADSPDPAVGWCNVNNASVIQGWIDRWKK